MLTWGEFIIVVPTQFTLVRIGLPVASKVTQYRLTLLIVFVKKAAEVCKRKLSLFLNFIVSKDIRDKRYQGNGETWMGNSEQRYTA